MSTTMQRRPRRQYIPQFLFARHLGRGGYGVRGAGRCRWRGDAAHQPGGRGPGYAARLGLTSALLCSLTYAEDGLTSRYTERCTLLEPVPAEQRR